MSDFSWENALRGKKAVPIPPAVVYVNFEANKYEPRAMSTVSGAMGGSNRATIAIYRLDQVVEAEVEIRIRDTSQPEVANDAAD